MSTMTIVDTGVVYDILVAAGLEDTAVRADYSGRFMYGQDCLGFVVDDAREERALIVALADEFGAHITDVIQTDSMGRGIIVYLPDYTCPEWHMGDDEDWDDDDEDGWDGEES